MYQYLVLAVITGVYTLDQCSKFVYRYWNPSKQIVPPSARWFFIHALTNFTICLVGWKDLKYCIANMESCIYSNPLWETKLAISIAIISHLYHIAVFWENLTSQDWLHHSSMVGIAGTLSLVQLTRVTSVGLWFMTGLPGMIDYSLLWAVKMGWLSSMTQKYFYTFISSFIRSPGCMLACFLTLPVVRSPNFSCGFIITLINFLLTFWNGQYYAMIACKNYGMRSSRNKPSN